MTLTATHLPPRVEDALWLLNAGEWPVSVARRAGYPSLHALARDFLRRGIPVPTGVWRELNLRRAS